MRLAGIVPVAGVYRGAPLVYMYEVQRHTRCRYPSGAMVALLLAEAGLETRLGPVVDVTYGKGKFWACRRPERLVGYDIRKLDWVVEPDVFRRAPAWAALHDHRRGDPEVSRARLVAVDPPWQECRRGKGCRGVGRGNGHYRVSRAVGSPETILGAAARLAAELDAVLVAHYGDRWVPGGYAVLAEAWWRPSLLRAREGYATWWGVLAPRR